MTTVRERPATGKKEGKGTRLSFLFGATPLPTLCRYLIIVLVGLAAYANTFSATFNFDDLAVIQGHLLLEKMSVSLPELLKGRRMFGDLTFLVNYGLHGLNVFGYHLVNLAIHLLNACLVSALVVTTVKTPGVAGAAPSSGESAEVSRTGRALGLFAALLFVAHPVQTQAVTYIVQRYTSLATLLYLAALLFYVQARLSRLAGEQLSGPLSIPLYILAILAGGLALRTKEIAFTLPFCIVLYEAVFFPGTLPRPRKGLLLLALLLLAAAAGLVFSGMASVSLVERLAAASREDLLPRSAYFFTQLRVIVTYLRLLFLPVGQRLEYDYPVFRTFFTPQVACSFLLLAALLVIAVYLWRRSGRFAPQRPVTAASLRLAAFGMLWFFLTLSVESSIIPIADVIFEHRLYLPSVGAFVAIVAAVVAAVDRLAANRTRAMELAGYAFLTVTLVLAVATFQRNRVWATEATLWTDTVTKSPNLSRPWNNLASVYIRQNEPRRAVAALVNSYNLSPGNIATCRNLALALDRLGSYDGRFRSGADLLDGQGRVRPDRMTEWYGVVLNNLGLAAEVLGNRQAAIDRFREAIRMAPQLAEPHLNLGLALVAAGDMKGAEAEYLFLEKLDPPLAGKMILWMRATGGSK
jgi:protein O-mannosyl-transferase